MNAFTIECLIRAFAVNAEIEGMKAENIERERHDHALAFTAEGFDKKRQELEALANHLNVARTQGVAE